MNSPRIHERSETCLERLRAFLFRSLALELCLFCTLGPWGTSLVAESAPSVPAKSYTAADVTSPRLKTVLKASLLAYSVGKPSTTADSNTLALEMENASIGEVRVLPRFTVRESAPPKPENLLTMQAKLDIYLGPKDGLDRGLLNNVVLRWGDAGVGLTLFDAEKNETRAKVRERDVKRLRQRMELLDLVADLKSAGDDFSAKQLKRQSDSLFSRGSRFDRK